MIELAFRLISRFDWMLGRREALLSRVRVGQGNLVPSLRLGDLKVLAEIGGRIRPYRRLSVLEGLGFRALFGFRLGFLLGVSSRLQHLRHLQALARQRLRQGRCPRRARNVRQRPQPPDPRTPPGRIAPPQTRIT